jgi:hypothetical protein
VRARPRASSFAPSYSLVVPAHSSYLLTRRTCPLDVPAHSSYLLTLRTCSLVSLVVPAHSSYLLTHRTCSLVVPAHSSYLLTRRTCSLVVPAHSSYLLTRLTRRTFLVVRSDDLFFPPLICSCTLVFLLLYSLMHSRLATCFLAFPLILLDPQNMVVLHRLSPPFNLLRPFSSL